MPCPPAPQYSLTRLLLKASLASPGPGEDLQASMALVLVASENFQELLPSL